MKFNTRLIHGGTNKDTITGAMSVPIYQASTFEQNGMGQPKEYEYSRPGSPTRYALETLITELEGGNHGFAFSPGLAGIHAIISMLGSEDHILLGDDIYGRNFRLLNKVSVANGLSYTIVNVSDLSAIEVAIQPSTKVLFLETSNNPLLEVTDIEVATKLAKRHQLLTIVDSMLAIPYSQRPLASGADIVVHSGTKYLEGYSDVVSGLVVTNHLESAEEIAFLQDAISVVLGPHGSWLAQHSPETLGARMATYTQNAQRIAEFLEACPTVATVYHPGLASHPGHETTQEQMSGFSGTTSFELVKDEQVVPFVETLKVFALAESLGGVESSIEAPAIMTYAPILKESRETVGIKDGLIRLPIGIETVEDLLANLEKGLQV